MTAVIATANGSFDPVTARKAGKPVLRLQAGIDPGAIEEKEAARVGDRADGPAGRQRGD